MSSYGPGANLKFPQEKFDIYFMLFRVNPIVNDQRQPQVLKWERGTTHEFDFFRTEDLRAPSESNCLILSATRLLVFFYFYWFRGRYHFDEMSYSRRFWFQEGKRFDFWKLEMITQIPHCDNSPSYDSCNIDFSIIIEDAIMQEERSHNYGDLRFNQKSTVLG